MAAPWDIEPHAATFGVVGGPGDVIDPTDRKIPYTAAALAKRNDIIENHPYDDPQAHCAPGGNSAAKLHAVWHSDSAAAGIFGDPVRSATHVPDHSHRRRPHIPSTIKLWQGDSVGHWEGNTLVVDYANTNGKHWFDMAGNFETPNLHVVERLTLVDGDTIHYEARIEDPTFTPALDHGAAASGATKKRTITCWSSPAAKGEHDLQHYLDDKTSEQFKGDPKKQ